MIHPATDTYENHRRAEYAHTVAEYRRAVDTFAYKSRKSKSQAVGVADESRISYSAGHGAVYGGLAGVATGMITVLIQGLTNPAFSPVVMSGFTGSSLLGTVCLTAFLGAMIGRAVVGMDQAFNTYQRTSLRGGLAKLN